MLDIFAWIVLAILVASAVAMVFIAGSLPGHATARRRDDRRDRQRLSGNLLPAGEAQDRPLQPVLEDLAGDRPRPTGVRAVYSMGWGAPQGAALVVRNSVPIVPDVAVEVIEVPVEPNVPFKAGDVLFKIDPKPFQARVDPS